ncbi:MAG: molybdopterin-dependent oxidoreductase, partial [Paracoccaceae bacterium]
CEIADLHLPLTPGSDATLFNLLLVHLADHGQTDPAFLTHVNGYDASLTAARLANPADTGLTPTDLQRFLALWSQSERVVTVYSQGINQSDTGTDKVNAIINCHLATGRIGRPGMGPFSITGQPNAMGGREVGGLANMLACHLEIENPTHRTAVQAFWASPSMATRPGLKAVDMFRAVEDGRIKALWIIHTNPAATMPEADRVARAITACDFTVVSDVTAATDTARLAQVLLPAAAWGEKDGTVTNSERVISRQRAFQPAPGSARADWWQLAQVAQRMGFDGFDWQSPAQIFRENAALSGIAGALGSDFDISLKAAVSDADYAAMTPFTWPQSATKQGGRFFATGQFHTPDARARMIPIATAAPQTHAFRLNTGRIRDQWHSMTRTGLSPRLSQHLAEPFLEIHPDDAATLNLAPATLARVSSPHGAAILRTLVTDRVLPGHPFAPIHWTNQTAPTGRVDALVTALTDPISGQPASKSTPVTITPFPAAWYGFAIASADFTPTTAYWAKATLALGHQAELAGDTTPDDWTSFAATLFNLPPPDISLSDPKRGLYRCAFLDQGRLRAALFIAPSPVALSRSHIASLLTQPAGHATLAGHPGADQPDPGPTICACFSVGANTIARAIADQGLVSVAAIGSALRAGTNCGSCRPDIAALIARHAPFHEAAE